MTEWIGGILLALIGAIIGVEYARWRGRRDTRSRGADTANNAPAENPSGRPVDEAPKDQQFRRGLGRAILLGTVVVAAVGTAVSGGDMVTGLNAALVALAAFGVGYFIHGTVQLLRKRS